MLAMISISVICECGMRCEIKPKMHGGFRMFLPARFAFRCPILAPKLKGDGRLDSWDSECPKLKLAADLGFSEGQRQRQREPVT